MDTLPEGPMLDLVLASLDFESLANLYFTNTTLQELVKRYLEIHDYALPGANKALLEAAQQGKTHVVQFTLLTGADVQANDDYALRAASAHGHVDIVRLLLEAGADVHARNDEALRAASSEGHKDIVRLLIEAGGCALGRDEWAESQKPLMIATINNAPDVVEALITSTKSAKEREMLVHSSNDACLRLAAQEGYTGVVRVLLDNGANFLALNSAALTLSSRYGYEEIVRLLLQAGDDVHSDDDRALREASLHGHLGVVEILLEAGADVYAKNMAALVNAVRNGHEKVAQTLRAWK